MAREYEAEPKPMPEPLHERVLVLEKELRQIRERLEEQDEALRAFIARASRELGL